MPYSQPELSFISSSLLNTPPIRPDLRTSNSFRPLRAETEILPFTNGSARIVSEAGECIVGVKAEVENFADQLEETVSKTERGRGGIEVGITAKAGSTGLKEEELFNLVGGWERTLEEGLREDGIEDRLGIGRGYGWKLYVDVSAVCPFLMSSVEPGMGLEKLIDDG
jgi:exosome complex component RRP42